MTDDLKNSISPESAAMIPLIGNLYRKRLVEISVFGQLMVKRTVNEILKAHEYVRRVGLTDGC
jgi:hypothetical protein